MTEVQTSPYIRWYHCLPANMILAHFTRRTPRPTSGDNDDGLWYEQSYTTLLEMYERQCREFDSVGGFGQQPFDATRGDLLVLLERAANEMHTLRYDFIQHYMAYHHAKMTELDTAIMPVSGRAPAFGMMACLCERKLFYQEQCSLLKRMLVQRAGHSARPERSWHAPGETFYDAVAGSVASTYQADSVHRAAIIAANRQEIEEHEWMQQQLSKLSGPASLGG